MRRQHQRSQCALVQADPPLRAAHDRRLQALSEAIAAYEAEFGEITAEEVIAQVRADRETAVIVRGRRSGRRKPVRKDTHQGAA